MSDSYFTPWIGRDYQANRILVMSESTYNWMGEDGEGYSPTPLHAKESIPWHIENFGQNRYFTAMNRTLCGEYQPSSERMQQVWEQYAYTVFVQKPVGDGPGKRPTSEHWNAAGPPFDLLDQQSL